jgi:branched-chain amino acid transport system permease protein
VLIEEIILQGAISSGLYALLALGFTLIYGVAGVVNLAHGSFYMFGAFMFYVFGTFGLLGLDNLPNSILALVLGVVVMGIVGIVVYRLTIHPVLGDDVAVMVVTVCLALIFQQSLMIINGGSTFPPVKWPDGSLLGPNATTNIFGLALQNSRILAFVVSFGLFLSVLAFIAKTRIGKAMRAVSQDRQASMLMGINTNRVYMLTMGISAMLAALSGILITTSIEMTTGAWSWLSPLALAFSIVILGGLGSIKGSLLGGFIIGYTHRAVADLVPEGGAIVDVIPLVAILVVLLVRPKGLFGKRVEMEE